VLAGVSHVQLDAAGHSGERAIETRERGGEVAVGRDVAQRLTDQGFGVDFEHAAGRGIGARYGTVGIEGDHRIRIVVENRSEALFARLDLFARFVALGDVTGRTIDAGDRAVFAQRSGHEFDREGVTVEPADREFGRYRIPAQHLGEQFGRKLLILGEDEIGERMVAEFAAADAHQAFGRGIRIGDAALQIEKRQRVGRGAEECPQATRHRARALVR
jgi:hypothetical protein